MSIKEYHEGSFWLVLLTAGVFVMGCHDPDDFGVGSGHRYCGTVVGSDEPAGDCNDTNCSFIRRGFIAGTTIDVSFAPELGGCMTPEDTDTWAGVLTSSDEAFDCTFFDVIEPLQHDLLSQYDFPGAERIRNYIYTTRMEHGELQDRDVMLFWSALDGDKAELRIVVGKGDERDGDYFGLFPLELSASGCL